MTNKTTEKKYFANNETGEVQTMKEWEEEYCDSDYTLDDMKKFILVEVEKNNEDEWVSTETGEYI